MDRIYSAFSLNQQDPEFSPPLPELTPTPPDIPIKEEGKVDEQEPLNRAELSQKRQYNISDISPQERVGYQRPFAAQTLPELNTLSVQRYKPQNTMKPSRPPLSGNATSIPVVPGVITQAQPVVAPSSSGLESWGQGVMRQISINSSRTQPQILAAPAPFYGTLLDLQAQSNSTGYGGNVAEPQGGIFSVPSDASLPNLSSMTTTKSRIGPRGVSAPNGTASRSIKQATDFVKSSPPKRPKRSRLMRDDSGKDSENMWVPESKPRVEGGMNWGGSVDGKAYTKDFKSSRENNGPQIVSDDRYPTKGIDRPHLGNKGFNIQNGNTTTELPPSSSQQKGITQRNIFSDNKNETQKNTTGNMAAFVMDQRSGQLHQDSKNTLTTMRPTQNTNSGMNNTTNQRENVKTQSPPVSSLTQQQTQMNDSARDNRRRQPIVFNIPMPNTAEIMSDEKREFGLQQSQPAAGGDNFPERLQRQEQRDNQQRRVAQVINGEDEITPPTSHRAYEERMPMIQQPPTGQQTIGMMGKEQTFPVIEPEHIYPTDPEIHRGTDENDDKNVIFTPLSGMLPSCPSPEMRPSSEIARASLTPHSPHMSPRDLLNAKTTITTTLSNKLPTDTDTLEPMRIGNVRGSGLLENIYSPPTISSSPIPIPTTTANGKFMSDQRLVRPYEGVDNAKDMREINIGASKADTPQQANQQLSPTALMQQNEIYNSTDHYNVMGDIYDDASVYGESGNGNSTVTMTEDNIPIDDDCLANFRELFPNIPAPSATSILRTVLAEPDEANRKKMLDELRDLNDELAANNELGQRSFGVEAQMY